jgi:adenylate cyclase
MNPCQVWVNVYYGEAGMPVLDAGYRQEVGARHVADHLDVPQVLGRRFLAIYVESWPLVNAGTTREVERRFRVAAHDFLFAESEPAQIVQGYATITPDGDIRVRLTPSLCTIAFNGPRVGAARLEWETSVPSDVAEMLLRTCGVHVVTKLRYPIVDEVGQLWAVDRFQDANEGLILAEIEFDDRASAIHIPSWLGLEVTDDPRYFNRNLAQEPYVTWGQPQGVHHDE